jgi:hypothetical protein
MGLAMMGFAPAAFAQGGGPPKIDIQKVCHSGAGAIIEIFGDSGQDVEGTCVQDEQAARDEIEKGWGDFPALAKSRCVQPKEYLPSYVEWASCMEMTRDVIKMRHDRAAAQGSGGYEDHDCPIVKTDEDGNLLSIDTCLSRRRR